MTFDLLPFILIATFNSLLAFYVYRRARFPVPASCFAFLALTIAGWTCAIAQAHFGNLAVTFFTRLTFAFAVLMPAAILCLFRTFPHEPRLALRPSLTFLLFATLVFSLLSFSPLVVRSAHRTAQGLVVAYGPLHSSYGLVIILCLLVSGVTLLRRYRQSHGLVRLQFRYFLLGLLVPGLAVLLTNFVIPFWLGISHYGQYGPYFAVIFLASSAHALLRYRLMDVRVVLRQSLVFFTTLFLTSLSATVLYILGVPFFSSASHLPSTPYSVFFLSMAISLLLPNVNSLLVRLLSTYTFRRHIDYAAILQTASLTLSRTIDLPSLSDFIVPTVVRALDVEHASLYVWQSIDYRLVHHRIHASSPHRDAPGSLPRNLPLMDFLNHTRDVAITEELRVYDSGRHQPVTAFLIANDISAVIPVFSNDTLIAGLCLGPKLSGDPFFPHDIAFLSALAGHATTALTNAMLYRTAVLTKQHLSNIVSSLDSAVLAINTLGEITLFNRAASRLTAIPDTASSSPTIDHLATDLATSLRATLADSRPRLSIQTTLLDDSRTPIPVGYSTLPLRDHTGQIDGAILVINDLTVLKTLETHATQADRLASLSSLAAALAHEIKNPLVAIRAFAELLHDHYTDDEFRAYFSSVVVSEINRIDDLVQKLNLIAIPTVVAMEPINVRVSLDTTLALLRGHVDLHSLTVLLRCEIDHPIVLGNEPQLKQLFLNVLLNAIHASRPNTTISLSITRGYYMKRPSVRILIVDTGVGIPVSLLDQIFDPFVSHSLTGTGLGLSIARSIVSLHRGSIAAANNNEHPGATFTIDLPTFMEDVSVLSTGDPLLTPC